MSKPAPPLPVVDARLILAYAGRHTLWHTRWTEHRLQHWVLDLITSGSQTQRVVDSHPFVRSSGVLALYAPWTRYYEKQVEGLTLTEAYMLFTASGEVEHQLRELTGSAGYCHIEDPYQLVSGPLQRLGARFLVHNLKVDILTHALMLECIGYLPTSTAMGAARRRLAPAADPEEALLTRVAGFLDANTERSLRVSDLAAALGISTSSLGHIYPKVAGETPYQAILRSKITAAKRLLLGEGMNVKETAYRLGFSSQFNFSRAFRRMEGCSPSRYVARNRKSPA